MSSKELDIEIEEYLEGRMAGAERTRFEERLKTDAELRRQVETTNDSIKMVRQALVRVEPSGDFEDKVSSKIVSITQSNPNLRPMTKGAPSKLSANDPDARLIHDPVAEKERQRLVRLAVVAGVLFVAAIAVIVWSILRSR